MLDGETHAVRKRTVLQALGRDALAAYLPIIQKRAEDDAARWSEENEIRWVDEMKRLAIEVICSTIIGMPRLLRKAQDPAGDEGRIAGGGAARVAGPVSHRF